MDIKTYFRIGIGYYKIKNIFMELNCFHFLMSWWSRLKLDIFDQKFCQMANKFAKQDVFCFILTLNCVNHWWLVNIKY